MYNVVEGRDIISFMILKSVQQIQYVFAAFFLREADPDMQSSIPVLDVLLLLTINTN